MTALRTIHGTPDIIAPETMKQMFDADDEFGYTFAVDLCSLGVTTF